MRRNLVLSAIDQAILSIVSFGIGLAFIRWTTKEDYGVFLLCSALILLVVGIQNALISTPMTVRGPQMASDRSERFYSGLYRGQVWVTLGLGLLAGATVAACWLLGVISTSIALIGIGTTIAAIGALKREFARSLWFLKGAAARVVKVDVLYGLIVALAAYWVFKLWVEAAVAGILVGMGVGNVPASFGGRGSLNPGSRICLPDVRTSLREAWADGRWTLPGVLITFGMNHAHTYLLVLVGGLVYVAEVGAARMLLMPVAMLNLSLYRVLRPRWATLRGEGRDGVIRHQLNLALVGILLITLLLVVVLYVLWDWIVEYMLTAEYAGIWMLVALWALFFAGQSARVAISNHLQIYGEFRFITFWVAASAVVVIATTILLVPKVGAEGVVYSMIAGEGVLLATLGYKSIQVSNTP